VVRRSIHSLRVAFDVFSEVSFTLQFAIGAALVDETACPRAKR
jgi:hypothetical protein